MYGEFDAPDISRENYEACREQEREQERDRYSASEIKELEAEQAERDEAKEEAKNERNIDHANDMKV